MIKYKHIEKSPKSGNLEFYAYQGCLFLNTSLTVTHKTPDSHTKIWEEFTNSIIGKLSSEKSNLVFVLWGAQALNKEIMIDSKKHKIIVSSHPSGYSSAKNLRKYPAFDDNDHFGQINEYLEKHKKQKIIWM
jgi:uracil-DNA glycosylase